MSVISYAGSVYSTPLNGLDKIETSLRDSAQSILSATTEAINDSDSYVDESSSADSDDGLNANTGTIYTNSDGDTVSLSDLATELLGGDEVDLEKAMLDVREAEYSYLANLQSVKMDDQTFQSLLDVMIPRSG